MLKNAREGRVRERGSDGFRGSEFGGLNTTIDAIISFPELIAES